MRTLKETSRTLRKGKVTYRLNILFDFTVYYTQICSRRGVICTSEVFEAAQFIFEARYQIRDPASDQSIQLRPMGRLPTLRLKGGWHYIIKSVHDGRKGSRVPEERNSSHCALPTSSDMLPAIKFSPYIYSFI